jgi:hypothetical protein
MQDMMKRGMILTIVFVLCFQHVAALATNQQLFVMFDSTNNLHRDITYHPEQPARIEA